MVLFLELLPKKFQIKTTLLNSAKRQTAFFSDKNERSFFSTFEAPLKDTIFGIYSAQLIEATFKDP